MVLLNFTFNYICSASQENDMFILGLGQRSPAYIFLSPTIPPNDMVCQNPSTTPNHGHVETYDICKFFCLIAINMKCLYCISCTGWVQIYNGIQ